MPHPFIDDGPCLTLKGQAIAEAAVAEARRWAVTTDARLISSIAAQIDKAELVRAGMRFQRGEGGVATVELGQFGARSDVPEQHMNAAQDAFGACRRSRSRTRATSSTTRSRSSRSWSRL